MARLAAAARRRAILPAHSAPRVARRAREAAEDLVANRVADDAQLAADLAKGLLIPTSRAEERREDRVLEPRARVLVVLAVAARAAAARALAPIGAP